MTAGFEIFGQQISALKCPSDGTDGYPGNNGVLLFGRSYMYCSGDFPDAGAYKYVETPSGGLKCVTQNSINNIEAKTIIPEPVFPVFGQTATFPTLLTVQAIQFSGVKRRWVNPIIEILSDPIINPLR